MTSTEREELNRAAAVAWESSGGELSAVAEAVAEARERQLRNPDVNNQAALIQGAVAGLGHLLRAVVRHPEVAAEGGTTVWLKLAGTSEVVSLPVLSCHNLAALLPTSHDEGLPHLGPFSCTWARESEGVLARADGGCVHCGHPREAEIHSEHRKQLVSSLASRSEVRAEMELHLRQALQEEQLLGAPLGERLLDALDRAMGEG